MKHRIRVMWATTALHKLGDISRPHGGFCWVRSRPENGNYIGHWVTGMGFCEVRFPVETTHTLTRAQRYTYNRSAFEIGGAVFKEAKPSGKS